MIEFIMEDFFYGYVASAEFYLMMSYVGWLKEVEGR
jgi:hypothetical protein